MRRLLIAGVAAIAGLSLLALLIVHLATSAGPVRQGPAPVERAPEEPAAAPPAEAPPQAVAAPAAARAEAPPPAGPQAAPEPAPGAAPAPRVLIRPIAPVARALGPLVAHCVPPDLHARDAVRRGRRGGGAPDAAALIVELAVVADGLEVVDADVVSYGELAHEHLDCARKALSGRRIGRPAGFQLEPGQRVRMRYVLP